MLSTGRTKDSEKQRFYFEISVMDARRKADYLKHLMTEGSPHISKLWTKKEQTGIQRQIEKGR
jgi:hypothetical protein